ncbi:cytidylate kinase [Pseudoloma neurophilia]|uniref:(d)CMP kinase n=1 Tax=Pseudoloma neurophilia TaxID=146866 RepID=A0A0R0M6N2_9MICR|nr:cytidylate kinase [Pseudoloma neurophilia]
MSKIYKIAIDGHAASGKSTSAQKIAKILNFDHINSGNIYRALLCVYLKKYGEKSFEKGLSHEEIEFIREIRFNISDNKYFWEGMECHLRDDVIDANVSKFASIKEIREIANIIQKYLISTAKRGIVMDGRDIATKILPDADLKVFMTASPKKRALRRMREKGQGNYDEILQEIVTRDQTDETRQHGPLVKLPDSLLIENDELSFDQQVDLILKQFEKITNKKGV